MNRKNKHVYEFLKSHIVVVWIYHGGGDFGKIFTLLITSSIIDLYCLAQKHHKPMFSGTVYSAIVVIAILDNVWNR